MVTMIHFGKNRRYFSILIFLCLQCRTDSSTQISSHLNSNYLKYNIILPASDCKRTSFCYNFGHVAYPKVPFQFFSTGEYLPFTRHRAGSFGSKETIMVRETVFFTFLAVFLTTGSPSLHAQELTIAVVSCPKTAKAGQDLQSMIQLLVANIGKSKLKNISVGIVLKKSPLCPDKGHPAAYSSRYYDGVLLKEGNIKISLKPGETQTINPRGALTIPWDTPVGRSYYVCAISNSENKQKSTTSNTCACYPIQIVGSEEGPRVTKILERCLTPGNTLTISGKYFGNDQGTITLVSPAGLPVNLNVTSWNDSTVLIRVPNDSNIKEGQQYTLSIRRSGESGNISAVRHYISVCPVEKTFPYPEIKQSPPPFFPGQKP